jgi:SAM-dependent methyltransferase
MPEHEAIDRQMQAHYQAVWQRGDAWDFETSEFEQRRYEFLLSVVQGGHYGRVLEVGCGSGRFTHMLAGISERVVAIDIADAAIERARVQTAHAAPGVVDLRAANIMEFDLKAEGPWDLVVLAETIYSLGWLYPFFDVAWFAARLWEATAAGGRLLLANTYGQEGKDWLMRPWLIDTYRDLFRNVGFRLEREEMFTGAKDGIDFQVLVSLFTRDSGNQQVGT